jgi:hypothetical protein
VLSSTKVAMKSCDFTVTLLAIATAARIRRPDVVHLGVEPGEADLALRGNGRTEGHEQLRLRVEMGLQHRVLSSC